MNGKGGELLPYLCLASFALSMKLASLPKNYYVHLSHVGNMWLQLGESESQTGNSNSNRATAETQSQSQCQNHFTYSCTRRTLLLSLLSLPACLLLPASRCLPVLPASAAVVAVVILVQCRLLCKWIRLFCKMSIAVGLQLWQKLLLGATVASEWFYATRGSSSNLFDTCRKAKHLLCTGERDRERKS